MTNLKLIKIALFVLGSLLISAGVVVTYFLAGLGAQEIIVKNNPEFVDEFAAKLSINEEKLAQTIEPPTRKMVNTKQQKMTEYFEPEMRIMHRVFFENEPFDNVLRLFSASNKVTRVRAALAFAAINTEFTHNEESGFPQKRELFWKTAEQHIPNIQNALFEALISSAKENTKNNIPYTLAWMPGQGRETIEVFAWAAQHHPDWWIRQYALYFVVEFWDDEPLSNKLLSKLVHDPDYRVRKEVLNLKINQLM